MLLDPFVSPILGSLKNRVVMSAMTRGFAGDNHRATEAMASYYGRRAEDGVALILTEGTIVDPSGDGYNHVPHIVDPAQVDSWRPVVDRVHAAGSKIFCQLWHCGRISHEDYTGGLTPVSSSAQQPAGINRQNNKPYPVPRPLRSDEMPEIHGMYRRAARNAIAAGFDGVEIHLGHGYLADSFFDARINDRTDAYGGSVENRCRFGLELTAAVLEEVGPERTMARISPSRDMGGIYDWPDLDAMLAHLIPAFDVLGLRLLDVSSARADYFQTSGRVIRQVRPLWKHTLIGGSSLTPDQAEVELREGLLDMVTWARHLLANPDFVTRLRQERELVAFDPAMVKTLV